MLPKEEDMLRKRELNFLLWTSDVLEVPADFPSLVSSESAPEKSKINIQCVAHVIVCACLFFNRNFDITTRAGKVFVLDPSEKGFRDDYLNEIRRLPASPLVMVAGHSTLSSV